MANRGEPAKRLDILDLPTHGRVLKTRRAENKDDNTGFTNGFPVDLPVYTWSTYTQGVKDYKKNGLQGT